MAKENTESNQSTQPARQRTRTGVIAFTRETAQELKRVRWPKRNEVVSYTAAVLIVCLVMGLVVWLFDIGVARLMSLIGLV